MAEYRSFRRQAAREIQIIRSVDGVLGRTDWDRSYAHSLRPDVRYYHVDEMIRPAFHRACWNLAGCRRHRLMVTNVRSALRGFDTVLEAVAILKKSCSDVHLTVAMCPDHRSSYGRFIWHLIHKLGIAEQVEPLGYLIAEELVANLLGSHCFVIASHAENSPNSLCEAMLVGLPCAVSFAGGMPSLVRAGQSGLFFPPGDPFLLATRLAEVFGSDDLAVRLGTAARQQAQQRHDPQRIVDQLLSAYASTAGNSITSQKG